MYGGHGPGDDPGAGLVIGGGKDDVSKQATVEYVLSNALETEMSAAGVCLWLAG